MWLSGKDLLWKSLEQDSLKAFQTKQENLYIRGDCMVSLDMSALHAVIWTRSMQADAGNCTYESTP